MRKFIKIILESQAPEAEATDNRQWRIKHSVRGLEQPEEDFPDREAAEARWSELIASAPVSSVTIEKIGEIEEDAKVATIGQEDGKERIEAALSQLGLHAESMGVKGIHTNHGEANKFDSIDGALKALASTKLRHYETLSVNFRRLQETAHDVIKDIARAANLDMQVGFQTQARDGSTWQHVDLYDEAHNLVAVAGVRNASRYKDHPDFGSYILISVKAEALEEEPVHYEQKGHNNDVAVGSLPDTSKEEHDQSVKDAAARIREKRALRAAESKK